MGEDGGSSIMKAVTAAKTAIDDTHFKIEAIERKLAKAELTPEERTKHERELEDIKAVLKANEAALRELHRENRQTANLALMVVALCLIIGVLLYSFLEA